MKPVSFSTHGECIVGNLFTAEKPAGLAFLFLHGWLGHQNTTAAQALTDFGCTSLTYAMRGNGESEGDVAKLVKADFLSDAVIAYDYLRAHVSNNTIIGIVGSSFGSYLAILLTELRPVPCISLRVPANYLGDTFDKPEPVALAARSELYDTWRSQPRKPGENKALSALHAYHGNVQIIESENDEQVPHQTIENFVQAVGDKRKLTYEVMQGAPHSLRNPLLQTGYGLLLSNWAKSQIPELA
jgi:pimeloyl-ACP methyl ester carboxylesterase